MFNDVHRFLDFVAVAFETCFDLISSFIFCVHSSRPGVESSRLAQSFRKRGPISNVISTKSSTILTCTYSILQYSEFLPVFFHFVSMLLLFQLHAKRAFAPKEAVGLCSCVSSCQFKSLRRFKQLSNTLIHSFLCVERGSNA